jgi:hypothetical protein
MKRWKPKKRPRSPFKYERSADLMLWLANGMAGGPQARFETDLGVSVGVTDAGQMGFVVYPQKTGSALNPTWKTNETNFVLDREQVAALIELLHFKLPGMPRRGKSDNSYAVLRLTNPTFRLNNELQLAAMKAHPGWRHVKDLASDPAEWVKDSEELPLGDGDDWTAEPGTPDGVKLIKWFYKTHPRKARRIERDFEKRLWAGKL